MATECKAILRFHEGDLLPFLYFEWENSGSIVGYTFKLHVRRQDGTHFTRDAVIDDDGTVSNTGAFHFEWQPGDLMRGRHSAEVEMWTPAMKNETWDGMLLDVRGDIA
jgi:hypothetical protein